MAGSIEIVSPMWPSEDAPNFGVFVRNIATSLEAAGFDVDASAVIRGRRTKPWTKATGHFGLGCRVARSVARTSDGIYLHAPSWFSVPVLAASRARHKRLVIHLHGSELMPSSRVLSAARRLLPWVLRRADLVVVPSRYFAREVEHLGVRAERLLVSPSGGIDRSVFHPRDRLRARERLQMPLDKALIGYVGTLTKDKGWDTFLRTVAALVSEGQPIAGVLVGDGRERQDAEALARALGLRSDVELHWRPLLPQTELVDAYAALDVLLFPTRRSAESLGLVPLEAMATGIAVVGSDAFAVPEYIANGKSGYLADPRDEQAFLRQTRVALARNPAETAAMTQEAIHATAPYDRIAVAEVLVGALRQVFQDSVGSSGQSVGGNCHFDPH